MKNWKEIEQRLNIRREGLMDRMLCKAFHEAGWDVNPESGYRFEKVYSYDDGSGCTSQLSKKDAWLLAIALQNVLWGQK